MSGLGGWVWQMQIELLVLQQLLAEVRMPLSGRRYLATIMLSPAQASAMAVLILQRAMQAAARLRCESRVVCLSCAPPFRGKGDR